MSNSRMNLPLSGIAGVVPDFRSLLGALGLLALMGSQPVVAQEVSFGPRTDYATGSAPSFVAIGDVNGDGNPDLAVANENAGTVSVLLGNSAGGFGAKTDFAAGPGPGSIAMGDLNGDGSSDLAVANSGGQTVTILLNNGSGRFDAGTEVTTGFHPESVAMADFNDDGSLDLATANYSDNTVSVLLGDGSGRFGARTDIATERLPTSVVSWDMNGDRNLDLVVANGGTQSVSIFLGNGEGGFGAATYTPMGDIPVSLAVGDMNGDGNPDLAVANLTLDPHYVTVRLASGTGGFGRSTEYAAGVMPRSVALADMNGDAYLDLVVASSGSSSVSILLGNGSGQFEPKIDIATGSFPYWAASADVDGDGKPDLAVANPGDNTVSILLNTTPGSNRNPDCSRATALMSTLWPPTRQMVPVTILGVIDPDGDPVAITVLRVTQDEPVEGPGVGNTSPDAAILNGSAEIRSERNGGPAGNGRVYRVSFRAEDGNGGSCEGDVAICVPIDNRPTHSCIDDGQIFESLRTGRLASLDDDAPVETEVATTLRMRVTEISRKEMLIEYVLPKEEETSIAIYNVLGKRVGMIGCGRQSAGAHEARWDPQDLGTGVYFYRLRAGANISNGSGLLLK